jgi:hypothetical protein
MFMNLSEFARRMTQHGITVEKNGTKVARTVALAVDQTVVIATPVDEGRARANWQVRVGPAATDVIPAYVPGKGGNTGAQNAQAAMEQGKIAISTAQPGQEIHITNNLPYIGALNDGHSAQAPAGFVEQAVKAGIETVRASKLLDGTE